MSVVRLNKHLAHTFGISRREADLRIEQGRVLVNGKTAVLGNVISPNRDIVTLDNSTAKVKRYTYLLLNKPTGYVSSRKQQGKNPTLYQLLPRQFHHLKVAGRLDKDSCGLVLLTDDGDTIFKLTHPKFQKKKVYHVALNKPLVSADKTNIENGIKLEDGVSKLQIATKNTPKNTPSSQPRIRPNSYTVTMHEGRNRQIRRTFKQLGYTVTFLERQGLGRLSLGELESGTFTAVAKPHQ